MKTPKFVDVYTFNKRIANFLERTLEQTPELEGTGGDSLFSFMGVPNNKVDIKEIDFLVEKTKEADIREYGGYEIRDSETGKFVKVLRSYSEEVARMFPHNN